MNPRLAALVLTLVLDAALLGRLATNDDGALPVRIHGIAPPLVHVPGAGEATVLAAETTVGAPPDAMQRALSRVVQARGTPAQRARLSGMDARRAALGPSFDEGHRLRVAVAQDTTALVDLVGPARTAAFLDAREAVSARWAEGRAWNELVARLAASTPAAP